MRNRSKFNGLNIINVFSGLIQVTTLSLCIFNICLADQVATDASSETAVYSEEVESEANSLFADVLSPFCPGLLLRDCPSSDATDLKDQLKAKIASGVSSRQLKEELLATYGDKVRAAPDLAGVGALAWLAPLLFIATGALIMFRWAIKSRAKPNI